MRRTSIATFWIAVATCTIAAVRMLSDMSGMRAAYDVYDGSGDTQDREALESARTALRSAHNLRKSPCWALFSDTMRLEVEFVIDTMAEFLHRAETERMNREARIELAKST